MMAGLAAVASNVPAHAGYCIQGQTVKKQDGTLDFLLTNYCENPVDVEIMPNGNRTGRICTVIRLPPDATRIYTQRAMCRSLNEMNTCACGGISWKETERPKPKPH
ncbi:MAG: hypothetical protein EON58_05970 [Alphaproteobacteria bacterium]|nr:MAG: hypothetical protein EON58_05970 [Alphaproteobacteria bacterium]